MTKEEFETWKAENQGNWSKLATLADELGDYSIAEEIVNYDGASDYIKSLDLATLYFALRSLDDPQADWFKINAYGHLENVDEDDWECYYQGLVDDYAE